MAGINTISDLWERLAKPASKFAGASVKKPYLNHSDSIERLANELNITPSRLIDILLQAVPRSHHYGWDALCGSVIVLASCVLLYCSGVLSPLIGQLKQRLGHESIVVARNLERGHILRSSDLSNSHMLFGSGDFHRVEEVAGLVLKSDVPTGAPIRAAQLIRPQVVAICEIPPDVEIGVCHVALKWTAADLDAATCVDQVLGKRSTRGFQNGAVVLKELIH